jgi:hypothetical protein
MEALMRFVFLWAVPRFVSFHQLHDMWSQPILHMAAAWSEIRPVRRVVKQLPVEMLQQCSSASSCSRCTLSWRSTPPDVGIPHFFFWMAVRSILLFHSTLVTSRVVVPCYMNCTFSTPLVSQEAVAISCLADTICLFNFFGLCGECVCVCIFYFDHYLVSAFTSEA